MVLVEKSQLTQQNRRSSKRFLFFQQQLTVATLVGRKPLSAVRRVEEEKRHLQEPAPTPRHLTVERTAVNWDQLRRKSHAMNRNAVS